MYYCVSPRGAHNVTSSVHQFNTTKNVFSITCRTVLPVTYTTYTLHEWQTWILAHTMQLACMQSPMSCSQPNKTETSHFCHFYRANHKLSERNASSRQVPITLSPQATEKQHINVHWSASQAMQISHEKGEKSLYECFLAYLARQNTTTQLTKLQALWSLITLDMEKFMSPHQINMLAS